MGAKGYTLTSIGDAKSVFDTALADIAKGKTVLIDAKISGDRLVQLKRLF
jgi:pyruvate oxidase